MVTRVLVSGTLGGIVLVLWAFVVNAGLGLMPRIGMKRVANEERVYQLLKESVTTPGGYVVSAPVTPGGMFPTGEPVFVIRYSGLGHESAGWTMLWDVLLGVLASMIAAALLVRAPGRTYPRKVAFFAALGLLFAIVGVLPQWDIGGYPLGSAALLAGNTVVSWVLAGLVIAWVMISPQPAA